MPGQLCAFSPLMFHSRRPSWLLAPLLLSACFGKVEYDAEPSDRGADGSALTTGAGGRLFDAPPQFPSLDAIGGSDAFSSGGSFSRRGSSGGLGGETFQEPQLDPPRREEVDPPECSKDCCPEALTQITFSLQGDAVDGNADRPYFSRDGMWITFSSSATNLIDGDFNGQREVFTYSLATKEFRHVSLTPQGELGNAASEANSISSDGRWILLTSSASNLSTDDNNGNNDVFLYDRESEALTLVSRARSGSAGNGASLGRDLSPDGRYVVYSSGASDLVEGDDNEGWDVFVWDRTTQVTERISMGPGDQQSNPVSGDHAHISSDGRFVSYHSLSDLLSPGDENGNFDIFLSDRTLGTTTRVSHSLTGGETNGNVFVLGMSDDAQYFSSYSDASDLVAADTNGSNDVFLIDRNLGSTARVNLNPSGEEADLGSSSASLSGDGRYLSFASQATNLASAGLVQRSHSYVHDAHTGRLWRLSQNESGEAGNGTSQPAQIDGKGSCYVFASRASNLSSNSLRDETTDLFVGRLPQ